ncbi:coiled-coil domain-containing protein 50 isoform X2 [Pogoniulus pusillus]|uniref:coiled-coil domain-containing protein 50 isoform X2 n=1 Tax=Pogoniulus pusillus TaxID=488313 RepID=UPI0030B926F9
MAGIGIDHSKLPGVKEVCRDFAVLEDHTLAHNLQEQEIEHHLATNVQRNRLVQHDLKVAKKLQEEEDLKARAQKHQKDLERQDCEMAQEIQVKLVFEAEQRRRQEEKDEDIARLLQLQEEKKHKKHYPEPQGHTVYEDSYYAENGEQRWGRPREQVSERHRASSGDRDVRRRRECRAVASPSPSQASRRRHCPAEPRCESSPSSKASSGPPQEGKSASQGRSRRHPSLDLQREAEHSASDYSNSWELQERRACREKAWRPHSLDLESERGLSEQVQHSRKQTRQTRAKHLPHLDVELEAEQESWHRGSSHLAHSEKHKPHRGGRSAHRAPPDEDLHGAEARDSRRRGEERDCKRTALRRPSPSLHAVSQGKVGDHQRDSGTRSRGSQQAMYDKPQSEQELSDAEMARKLQEEELLASEADQKAAQVAQDEEIARLLMAEEKKAFKKGKEREKSSLEKRRHDQDWKRDASESTCSRSKEGPEAQRHKGDRPARSQPHLDDFEHARYYTSQPSPSRQVPKPEHSPKGSRRKQ